MKVTGVLFSAAVLLLALTVDVQSTQLDYLPNSLIQDFISHIQSDRPNEFEQAAPENLLFEPNVGDAR